MILLCSQILDFLNRSKHILIVHLFLLLSFIGNSQILDDSTHLKYGAFTTKYYTDKYFFEDSILLKSIDSSFLNQHEFDGYFMKGKFYQNLGNTVTPSLSLLYNPTSNTLQNLASDRYSFFRFNNKKYYNTLSPYTFLKYIQGSRNDNILEGMYTQNINDRWNIGSEFYRGVSRKQYATNGSQDKLSSVWSVRTFTSYLSKNKRYHLLGDIETQNAKMNEQWGVNFPVLTDSAINLVIDAGEFADNNWNSATNEQKYREISVKQRYDIVKGYSGVYMHSRFRRDKRIYIDDDLDGDYITSLDTFIVSGDTTVVRDTLGYQPEFYNQARYSIDTTYDEKLFDSFENEIGVYVKSDLWHIKIGYLQQNYGYSNNYQSSKKWGIDNIVKGAFNYHFIEKFNVNITTENNLSGAFQTIAEVQSKYASLSYKKMLSNPFLVDQYINSNHMYWDNDFKKINTDEYKFKLGYTFKNIAVHSENRYLNINNQVFYDTTFTPFQEASTINIFQSTNYLKVSFKKWNIEQRVLYTSKNNKNIQLPAFTSHSRIYWLGKLSKGVINAQIGGDIQWRSNYNANSYLPLVQNFYVQHDIQNFGYPLVDLFANFNIKTVDFFVKFGHVNQALGRPGYLVSAYYPAKRFNFAVGVKWRFFD